MCFFTACTPSHLLPSLSIFFLSPLSLSLLYLLFLPQAGASSSPPPSITICLPCWHCTLPCRFLALLACLCLDGVGQHPLLLCVFGRPWLCAVFRDPAGAFIVPATLLPDSLFPFYSVCNFLEPHGIMCLPRTFYLTFMSKHVCGQIPLAWGRADRQTHAAHLQHYLPPAFAPPYQEPSSRPCWPSLLRAGVCRVASMAQPSVSFFPFTPSIAMYALLCLHSHLMGGVGGREGDHTTLSRFGILADEGWGLGQAGISILDGDGKGIGKHVEKAKGMERRKHPSDSKRMEKGVKT